LLQRFDGLFIFRVPFPQVGENGARMVDASARRPYLGLIGCER